MPKSIMRHNTSVRQKTKAIWGREVAGVRPSSSTRLSKELCIYGLRKQGVDSMYESLQFIQIHIEH